MAKTKKKVSSQSIKQKEAEHQKLFRSKLKGFFVACNHGELYHLIDEMSLKMLYIMRFHPPTVKLEAGLNLKNKEIQMLKNSVHDILRNLFFTIPKTENKMSFYDYLTVVFDARTIIRPTTAFTFPGVKQMVSEMQPIYEELFSEESLQDKLNSVCYILESLLSEIDQKYVCVECLINDKDSKGPIDQFVYSIRAIQSPMIHVAFEGENRPAFQIGLFYQKQYFPITLTAVDLELNTEQYPNPIPIYIQRHALLRLKERVDIFEANYYTITTICSFSEPEIKKTGKNAYLIAYKLHEYKLGYFKADLSDGKLIIRTFLFLTNCGTPEELKLRALTGLRKADYDFLNMGKLSTLVRADFHKNHQTSQLLEEAGLKPILDYARNHEMEVEHHYNLSNMFLNYIQPNYQTYYL